MFTETWDGTAAGWPAQWLTFTDDPGAVIDRVSGKGRMSTGTTTYGNCGSTNAVALTSNDYTLTFDVVIPILSEWYVTVNLRGPAGLSGGSRKWPCYQLRFVGASGSIGLAIYDDHSAAAEVATYKGSGVITGAPVAGDVMRVVVEVSGTGPVTLRQKAWKVGVAEPAFTNLSSMFSGINYNGAYFGIAVTGGANTVSESFLFDDLSLIAMGSATQTVQLPLVTTSQTLFAPTTSQAFTMPFVVVPDPVVYAPTVAPNILVTMELVTNTFTVFAPTVSRSGLIELPFVTVPDPTVFSPGVTNTTGSQTVVLPLVYASASDQLLDETGAPILDETGGAILLGEGGGLTVFPPSVAITTGNQTATLPLVTVGNPTVYEPTVTTSKTVTLPLVTVADPTVFAPTITQFDPILLPLVVVPDPVVFAPSVAITTGVQVPTLPLVVNPFTVYAPSVLLAITGVVEMPFVVVDDPIVFLPSVAHAEDIVVPTIVYYFEPPHDENGPRKLSEQGRRRAGVSRKANNLSQYFAAPRSFSVLKNDGVYQVVETPDVASTLAADVYYPGGHVHEVNEAEALALIAAGFTVTTTAP